MQEKCGFAYHHTAQTASSMMGDVRTEHFTFLPKERWEADCSGPEGRL